MLPAWETSLYTEFKIRKGMCHWSMQRAKIKAWGAEDKDDQITAQGRVAQEGTIRAKVQIPPYAESKAFRMVPNLSGCFLASRSWRTA